MPVAPTNSRKAVANVSIERASTSAPTKKELPTTAPKDNNATPNRIAVLRKPKMGADLEGFTNQVMPAIISGDIASNSDSIFFDPKGPLLIVAVKSGDNYLYMWTIQALI